MNVLFTKIQNIFRNGPDSVEALQLFQIIRFGAMVLTGVCLVKLGITVIENGQYEAMILLIGASTFFWINGLLQGLLPSFAEKTEGEKKDLWGQVTLFFILFSALTSGVLFLGQEVIISWLGYKGPIAYYQLVCLYILLHGPSFILEYLFLIKEQAMKILYFGLLSFVGFLLAVVIPFALGYSLLVSFQAILGLALIRLIWLGIELRKIASWPSNFRLGKDYFLLSLPLIMYMVVTRSAEFIDGVIVSSKLGEEQLVIFRYGAREFPLALALTGAFAAAFIPKIAKDLEKTMYEIRIRSASLIRVLFPISIVLMFISPWAFEFFFNEDYLPSAVVFNVYLLLIICRLTFPQTILIGLKKTKVILGISLAELLINITSSLLLLPHFGIMAVAAGTLIAFTCEKIMLGGYLYWQMGIKPNQYVPLSTLSIYSLLLVVSFLAVQYFIIS